MNSFYSVLVFCCVSFATFGQPREHYAVPPYTWAVRFSPFTLIDPLDNNITFGVEYAPKLRWSVATDVSYIFNSSYSQDVSTSGFIIRPVVRRFLTDTYKSFLEMDIFYKQAGYRIFDWLGKDDVNGVPSYEQLQEFVLRKQIVGMNVKAGLTARLSRNRKWRLEAYFGFGVRFKWTEIENEPNALYIPVDELMDGHNDRFSTSSSIPVGVRIVYVIK